MSTIAETWAAELSAHMQSGPNFAITAEMPQDERGKDKEIAYVAAVNGEPFLQVKGGMLTPGQAWEFARWIHDTISVAPIPRPAPAAADDDLPF